MISPFLPQQHPQSQSLALLLCPSCPRHPWSPVCTATTPSCCAVCTCEADELMRLQLMNLCSRGSGQAPRHPTRAMGLRLEYSAIPASLPTFNNDKYVRVSRDGELCSSRVCSHGAVGQPMLSGPVIKRRQAVIEHSINTMPPPSLGEQS